MDLLNMKQTKFDIRENMKNSICNFKEKKHKIDKWKMMVIIWYFIIIDYKIDNNMILWKLQPVVVRIIIPLCIWQGEASSSTMKKVAPSSIQTCMEFEENLETFFTFSCYNFPKRRPQYE